MMATWTMADPSRHPWVLSPRKRKLSDPDSPPESTSIEPQLSECSLQQMSLVNRSESEDEEYSLPKRRRLQAIERRMERLKLDQNHEEAAHQYRHIPLAPGITQGRSNSSVDSVNSSSSFSSTHTYIPNADDNPIRNAYAVEEPSSPEFAAPPLAPRAMQSNGFAPGSHGDYSPIYTKEPSQYLEDVTMRPMAPAWYEREKDRKRNPLLFSTACPYLSTYAPGIVVTDLEELIAEQEREELEFAAAEKARIEKEKEDEYASSAEPHPDSSDFAASNANLTVADYILDHLRRQNDFPYRTPVVLPPTPEERSRGALVLFRPLPLPEGILNSSAARGVEGFSERSQNYGQEIEVEEIDTDAARELSQQRSFITGTLVYDDADDMAMDIEL